jgi:hypothetical protein
MCGTFLHANIYEVEDAKSRLVVFVAFLFQSLTNRDHRRGSVPCQSLSLIERDVPSADAKEEYGIAVG